MKTYSVSMTLSIKASCEEEARQMFWEVVDDCANDNYINNDSLEVEEEKD